MAKVLVFTDSIGEECEVRHIVKVSTRLHGEKFYETNDGKWFSKRELQDNVAYSVDCVQDKDLILTSSSSGLSFPMYVSDFNFVASMQDCPHYDYEEYTNTKPLPQGL